MNYRSLLDCDVYPLGDGRTPASLRIEYCQGILKHMQFFKQLRPSEIETGSLITLYFLHMGVFSLIPILNADSASQEPFTEFCGSVLQLAFTWPPAAVILRGAEAFSGQLGVSLPPDSLRFSRMLSTTRRMETCRLAGLFLSIQMYCTYCLMMVRTLPKRSRTLVSS